MGTRSLLCTSPTYQAGTNGAVQFCDLVGKDAVLAFANACKQAGVRRFQLLSSVGASADSRSFYLRSKGELRDALNALDFERLSIFQPSMILTPSNRYGWTQGFTLAVWPWLNPVLRGRWQAYRESR